jgi:hypothetical protein
VTPGARQALKALEAAGEAGCTNGDLASAGGWSWRNRVLELRRLGYDIHEQGGLWFLEGVPGVEGARGVESGSPLPSDSPVSSGTLSTGTLFDPPAPGHYESDVAA